MFVRKGGAGFLFQPRVNQGVDSDNREQKKLKFYLLVLLKFGS